MRSPKSTLIAVSLSLSLSVALGTRATSQQYPSLSFVTYMSAASRSHTWIPQGGGSAGSSNNGDSGQEVTFTNSTGSPLTVSSASFQVGLTAPNGTSTQGVSATFTPVLDANGDPLIVAPGGTFSGQLGFNLYPGSGSNTVPQFGTLGSNPILATLSYQDPNTGASKPCATIELDPEYALSARIVMTSGGFIVMLTPNPDSGNVTIEGLEIVTKTGQIITPYIDGTNNQLDLSGNYTEFVDQGSTDSLTFPYSPDYVGGTLRLAGTTVDNSFDDYAVAQLAQEDNTVYTALDIQPFTVAPVPEPGNIALLAALVTGGVLLTWRQRTGRAS